MFVQCNLIGGFMFGVEFLWGMGIMVIDLGIFRFYIGNIPKEEQDD